MAKFPSSNEVLATHRGKTLVHCELVFGDAAQTYTVPVKAGMFVHEIKSVVVTAFNGTGESLTIGDGTDPDGFLTDAVIDLDATADYATYGVKSSSDVDGDGAPVCAYGYGKYYAADDTIDFAFDPGTATAGRALFTVELSSVLLDDIAA